MITHDHFDYGETIAESWKRQTLINIVRLRYADTPLFMDITSIINSYSQSGGFSAGATVRPNNLLGNDLPLGISGAWSNTPTVIYQPLGGDKFTRSLLRPIAPTSMFQLLQARRPADLTFRVAVKSMNNISNRDLGRAEFDPQFDQSLQALDRIMQSQALSLRVEEHKDSEGVMMVIRRMDLAQATADGKTQRSLWRLEAGIAEFSVSYGVTPRNGREIAVLTRSMLAIALDMEAPSEHVA